jgi:hypothetical protein
MTRNKIERLGNTIDLTELSRTINEFKSELFTVLTGKKQTPPERADIDWDAVDVLRQKVIEVDESFNSYVSLVDAVPMSSEDVPPELSTTALRTRRQLFELSDRISKTIAGLATEHTNAIQEKALAERSRDKWKDAFEELQAALYDYIPEAELQACSEQRDLYLRSVVKPLSSSVRADIMRRVQNIRDLPEVVEPAMRQLREQFLSIEEEIKDLKSYLEHRESESNYMMDPVRRHLDSINVTLRKLRTTMLMIRGAQLKQ